MKIEVKGLSSNSLLVGLTPNEYENMNKYKDSYRLAVVTEALTNPTLNIFSYSFEKEKWISEDSEELIIDTIIAARCYI